jgi:hypothetical protein
MATKFTATVQLYRPWNVFTSAYATTYTGNFNYIGLNARKLNRSIGSICGSIAHEWGHCFEYYLQSKGFQIRLNHGDNSPVGKEDTFQYWLGRAVKDYVEEVEHELLRSIGAA